MNLINRADLATLAAGLRRGETTLEGLVENACDLIDRVNPRIRALLDEPPRRERLLREARLLAASFPDPGNRPRLFGVLVAVKDIFHVAGFETRAGSRLPPSLFRGDEAPVVTSLRRAGALVVGKAVTTEFAFFEPGPTRNPHNPAHSPGGSSSGSAAAVAAGLCHVALGTQTIGSIIRPAAYCGVVGFKPGLGRVSTAGVVPFSASADTVGFFTQDVEGMSDIADAAVPGWRWSPDQIMSPRLGVPVGPYLAQASLDGIDGFWQCVGRLRAAGLAVREVPVFDDIEAVNQRHRLMVAAEFALAHRDWFAAHGDDYGPASGNLVLEGQQVSAGQLSEARAGMIALRRQIHQAMSHSGVDLWISPAAQGDAPEGLASTGSPIMNLPWTHAGLPALNLPAGRSPRGLPLGLQLVARHGADECLLAWAASLRGIVAPP